MELVRVSVQGADEAEEAMRPFYPDIAFGSDGSRMSYDLRVHAAHGTTLLDFTIVAPRFRSFTEVPGFTVAENVTDGLLLNGDDALDTAGGKPVALPPVFTTRLGRVHTRAIELDEDAVRRFARIDLGDDAFRVRPTGTTAFTPESGALWTAAARFAEERMLDGSADSPLIGAALSQLLVSTYLACFPTTWSEVREHPRETGPSSAAVRRAVAFIEDNRHLPISMADIAQAARLSIRGVQAAFRRERGLTAMAYLRRVRLDAVRQELLAADPTRGASVGEIAQRWGFVQLGRFAQVYRDTYGELPSTTLRG